MNAVLTWSGRIAEFATKARTIQKGGEEIEKLATSMKADMDKRLAEILQMLRSHPATA